MARYNYYASPRGSDRAKAFRETYGNAPPGQNFMFEGQPYTGPPAPAPPNFLGGLNQQNQPDEFSGLLSEFNQMRPSEVYQPRPPEPPPDDMSGPRWTDFIKLRKNSRTPMQDYFQEKDWREHSPEELYERRMVGLLDSPEEQANSNTDKSGWMADQRVRDSQNNKFRLAQMFMNFRNQQSSDEGWDSPLTHY